MTPQRKALFSSAFSLVSKSDYDPPFTLLLKRGDELSFIHWLTQFTYFSQQGHSYSVPSMWKFQVKVLEGKQNRWNIILLSRRMKRKEWGTDISWAGFAAAFCCFSLILRAALEDQVSVMQSIIPCLWLDLWFLCLQSLLLLHHIYSSL